MQCAVALSGVAADAGTHIHIHPATTSPIFFNDSIRYPPWRHASIEGPHIGHLNAEINPGRRFQKSARMRAFQHLLDPAPEMRRGRAAEPGA
jgi:hypothetical protein